MANHQQVAHRWATRWEHHGRELRPLHGFNMFSDGDRIYSHGRHFEIARYVDTTPRKKDAAAVAARAVLFNDATYSVSTSQHQHHVRCAIPSHVPVFTVPDLSGGAVNLLSYEQKAADLQAKALRARVNGPWLIEWANDTLDEAERYAKAFGLKWARPDLGELAANLAKIDAAQRKAAEKRRREQEAKWAQRQREERAADILRFDAWLSKEPGVACPHSYYTSPEGGAYVRRSPDGEELQTSQGASVPWAHAVKAFRFIKLCRERGEAFHTNGRLIRVGHYRLDEVTAEGDLRAGCHRINWAQIEALAKAEGVFDAPASADALEVNTAAA